MILLDSRVASFRFRLLLAKFSRTHPEVQFDLPRISPSHLFIFLFTLLTIPVMLMVALLEVTRTRKSLITTISMLIPVFITRRSFSNIVGTSRKTTPEIGTKGDDQNIVDSSYALIENSSTDRISVGLSSPLLPFNSFFPCLGHDKYIHLVGYKDENKKTQIGTELGKLTYLPSIADTYENTLCHYFDLLERNSASSVADSKFMLTCGGKIPNFFVVLRLFAKRTLADLVKILRSLFLKKKYTWYVRIQIGDSSTTRGIIDLKNPENGYYADPFLFEHRNEIYLFVEEYSFSTSKGVVSVFTLRGERFERLGVCLEEVFHISFPNVFVDGEDIYMIPESSENRDVRLYRAVDFPLKWELSTQLLTDISAVDSMIYRSNQEYFLLTTVDTYELGDHATNLRVYKSPQIVSSNWCESHLNPVIRDAEKGRNAGRYDVNLDSNIRIAQASEFGTYGKRIRFFEVQDLSLREYSEVEMKLPELDIPSDSQGHHHLSSVKDIKAFDFSRFER
ncbi:glucosamine inositolphosphorylceramide transferase family protein [Candidatus Planktophila dulcis]|uniref:glucosamine inositolphosphorylceramide transferase family protein n=1 Tax=Candidatus Planktophila dulcis TaxID=1884914 RepID=UPI003CFA5E51